MTTTNAIQTFLTNLEGGAMNCWVVLLETTGVLSINEIKTASRNKKAKMKKESSI